MGAEGSKNEKKQYFSTEEHQLLLQTLSKIAGNTESVPTSVLEAYLSTQLDQACGATFIRSITNGRNISNLPMNVLVDRLGALIKGSMEERVLLSLSLAGGGKSGIESRKIIKYTETIIESFEKGLAEESKKAKWKSSSQDIISQLSVALLHDLLHPSDSMKKAWGKPPPQTFISYDTFERWWLGHCIFTNLETEMFKRCFKHSPASDTVLPQPTQVPMIFPALLTSAQVMYLNSALPVSLQSEWRFIFSTTTHGWSFSIFMKQVVGKGPTIIIIQDQSGNKYGGFASVSWEVRPQFHGTPDCFLFCLQPQAGIFHSTGFNTNFMYLNYLEKNTMPNGLGMGGREELFGLWIDYDFGKGTVAPTCTTYASPQLSPHQKIEIENLEIWALGPEEEDSDEEEGTRKKKSALDKNPEARAMLDMIGKVAVSDGYREEDKDD